MKLLGLNSPEIFLILVIILAILGPRRIEKGWVLIQGLLKFLLTNEEVEEAKSEEAEEIVVKEEVVEAKPEEAEEIVVKEEVVEAKSEEAEEIAVKEEVVEAKSEEEKFKEKKL